MLGIEEITLVRVGTGEIVYNVRQRIRKGRVYYSGDNGRGKRVIIEAAAMSQYARGILIGQKKRTPDNFEITILSAIQKTDGLSARVTIEIEKLAAGPEGDPKWTQPGVGVTFEAQRTWQGIVVQEDRMRQAAPAEDVE